MPMPGETRHRRLLKCSYECSTISSDNDDRGRFFPKTMQKAGTIRGICPEGFRPLFFYIFCSIAADLLKKQGNRFKLIVYYFESQIYSHSPARHVFKVFLFFPFISIRINLILNDFLLYTLSITHFPCISAEYISSCFLQAYIVFFADSVIFFRLV